MTAQTGETVQGKVRTLRGSSRGRHTEARHVDDENLLDHRREETATRLVARAHVAAEDGARLVR
eukprot:scaffold63277_cov63-Phaeocystis_antarctica.AAC.4